MQRTTESRARLAGVFLSASFVLAGCKKQEEAAPPPFGTFEVKQDSTGMKPAPPPPESILKPFRVWVNQERPRQKKNPEWRSFAAKDGAMLDLAADGKWRCLITPSRVLGRVGEHAPIKDWTVTRSVRCSADGFRTYLETSVRAGFDAQGAPIEHDQPAPVYLNDVVGGQPRYTAVVLATDDKLPIQRPDVD